MPIQWSKIFTGAMTILAMTLFSLNAMAAPSQYASPADAGVMNQQQIQYWLIKRGELAIDASEAAKQAAVEKFTRKASHNYLPAEVKILKQIAAKNRSQRIKVSPVSAPALADTDVTKTVNVLAVLVDFPDLPYNANRLTKSDTSMFYDDYSVQHYQDLLFSRSGFSGPNREVLQTAYQYFAHASGESFFFRGQVKGWVTASNNAAYYGANNSVFSDNDIAVPELVMEAVTQAVKGMSATELAEFDSEDPFDFNNNGNENEPDGIIDHIVIFHSSIGEEAGGGVLGTDAIWSHRFFVGANSQGQALPGTSMKVYGYTIQPIDSGTGVVTHEFGHDLGLPDEYDTNLGDGAPVGYWSLMASGTWVGQAQAGNPYIAGSKPAGLSPYARSYLQQRYQGKWVNEQAIDLADITAEGLTAEVFAAVNADAVNQLSIALPNPPFAFKSPLVGDYQYHSGKGHQLTNSLSFEVDLPADAQIELVMQAHWSIETDYDYMQLLIDGVAIVGNHTSASNPLFNNVEHYISGVSSDIAGASGTDAWVELVYDLSDFSGQSVQVEMSYVTDQAVGDYGIVIDQIEINQQGVNIYQDGAEEQGKVDLVGFSRIDDTLPGLPQRYIVQLRNHQGIDAGLQSVGYEPGILLWLENNNYEDNNVAEHEGYGFIGVIDADQSLITGGSSSVQVRDASFSLYPQSSYANDSALSNFSLFDDNADYSAPLQPQSGMVLPELGLTMEVQAQSSDSSRAIVEFKLNGVVTSEFMGENQTIAGDDGSQSSSGGSLAGVYLLLLSLLLVRLSTKT
ncbi:immune inhibitor A domain-containing protein [Shewanella sp. 10N.286.51.B8]|uniref:immune inhibitor A domain-containing protein n=1 Tax=Shewanella sp. 10N.286.51.B8 TaxID=3229708 RepID=UPI00354DB1EF